MSALYFSVVIGTRRVCLIVDEHERERDRLVDFAMAANVPVQVRSLPTGDYLWILTPPTQPEAPMEYKRVAPDVETVRTTSFSLYKACSDLE